jgi:hypothetical protein
LSSAGEELAVWVIGKQDGSMFFDLLVLVQLLLMHEMQSLLFLAHTHSLQFPFLHLQQDLLLLGGLEGVIFIYYCFFD